MELATVMSVVQTILTTIQTLDQLKASFSFTHFKEELERLQKTVNAIQSVLEDADAKHGVLNRQQMNFIEELKDAVYDANDVLDEFVTLVKEKKVHQAKQHKYTGKVRSIFSHFNNHTHSISNKVKNINKKLDDIASNSSKFMFKVDNKPMKFMKPETSSFVPANDVIIGRDEDVEKIVGMLLDCGDVGHLDVSSLAIVGMGGLGKTSLAQLVFNDPRVMTAFQLRSWTCIADHDQWNLTYLLGKIVKELDVGNNHDLTSLEQMQREVRKQLRGKKYLLVLDDVWTESYHNWQELENFLMVGENGSRIVVTTRSKKTAQNIGGIRVHELQGLPREESWRLFDRIAFLPQQRENLDYDLVHLGKKIVKKCANVPLAIRLVGSLLRGASKAKWMSFQDKELANISENDDTITQILKISYHQLDPPLKSCFAYCAIFPKDSLITKSSIINLWMSQGYISADYVGEEYFLILLQRCFFQDAVEDKWGDIMHFKMHDLLHDIAEQVAGEEICKLNSDTRNVINVGNRVRHLCTPHGVATQDIFNGSRIRTCIYATSHDDANRELASKLIMNWTCIRSLDLGGFECLPESIGKLFHLRYLNLSRCWKLEKLPESITKLVNLQTLDLHGCSGLEELPEDINKLPDLSTLNLIGCHYLSNMPSSIAMLTSLHTLGIFVEGRQNLVGLENLRSLNNLKGYLNIIIRVCIYSRYLLKYHRMGNYLGSKEYLKTIHISFTEGGYFDSMNCRSTEGIEYKHLEKVLLGKMQPHENVKEFVLRGYHGFTMPRWPKRGDNVPNFQPPEDFEESASEGYLSPEDNDEEFDLRRYSGCGTPRWPRKEDNSAQLTPFNDIDWCESPEDTVEYPVRRYDGFELPGWPKTGDRFSQFHLPKLVILKIIDCLNLVSLPPFEELAHLKYLTLKNLPNVKYVVKGKYLEASSSSEGSYSTPCLEELNIDELPNLICWESSICFQRLEITSCPKLTSTPICSTLELLSVSSSRKTLKWGNMSHIPRCYRSLVTLESKPKILTFNHFEWFKLLAPEYFDGLTAMEILLEKVESLGEVLELFHPYLLSSLRFLRIETCIKLRSSDGWFEQLSSLRSLHLDNCPNILDDIPWKHLSRSLQCLNLSSFDELEELPDEMQYCTSLESLILDDTPKLQCLPNWMPKLVSLQKFQLLFCSTRLKEKCQKPDGEDWPLIQHIPFLYILDEDDELEIRKPNDTDQWIYEHEWD